MGNEQIKLDTSKRERSIGQMIDWLDALVRMREDPEEIWYDVKEAISRVSEVVKSELSDAGEQLPAEFVHTIVDSYISYVYLGEWPRKMRPRLNKSSETIIGGYLICLPKNIDQIEYAFHPSRFVVLATMFRVIELGGYALKLPRRLTILAKLQKKCEEVEGQVSEMQRNRVVQ